MDSQQEDPKAQSSTEIVSVLADFTRLAQQMLVASAPDTLDAGTTALLKRLLDFWSMEQGALLLATRYHATSKQSFWPSLADRKTLRVLARHDLDEDKLFSLLTTFSGDEDIQASSSEPGWMICQQLLPVPNSSQQNTHTSIEFFPVPHSSTQSFFFLGRTETENQLSRQAMIEKSRHTWSLVADAVGSVIASLLQAEQMHDLETATSHRDLQQMELLKAELLATVSHELRSPLASIKGYAATLLRHERRISREERLEFLLAIHDASQRMELVINRLLEVSQLETETLPLQSVPVDLLYVVREAITAREQRTGGTNTSNPKAQQNGSRPQATNTFVLHIEDSDGKPTNKIPLVQADRRLLREVVDHLLENAVLYSPEGGIVEVGLRTRRPEQVRQLSHMLTQTSVTNRKAIVFPPSWIQDEPMAEIWIKDHGIGIAEAHLEQIFQRFYRVDTSLTREVNGLGLGLAICKQIVTLHHGLLWAESEVGKGSTFHVLLPTNGSVPA
jgi:signal transduction histidine kinase